MRISNNYIFSSIANNLNSNMEKVFNLQQKINSGKKYSLPSDDPIAATSSLRLTRNLKMNEHYQNVQAQVKPNLQMADAQLSTITEIIRNIRVDLNAAANATVEASQLQTYADNIDAAITNIINSANAEYNNIRLFSGYKTGTTPFELDGGEVRYYGDSLTLEQEISKGLNVDVTIPGNQIFQAHTIKGIEGFSATDKPLDQVLSLPATPSTSFEIQVGSGTPQTINIDYANDTMQDVIDRINGSTKANAYAIEEDGKYYLKIDSTVVGEPGEITFNDDPAVVGTGFLTATGVASGVAITGEQTDFDKGLLDTLISVRDDLQNGDKSNISDDIEKINKAYDNILQKQFSLGFETQRIETAQTYSQNEEFRMRELKSANEDIDFTEAISELSLQQQAYQAALQTSTRIMNMSILNYI